MQALVADDFVKELPVMFDEFAGAPNVIYVAPGTRPFEDGASWQTAYSSMSQAMGPNGDRSNVLVLVAPGLYVESQTFGVRGSNVSIVGAGAGTLIESTPPPAQPVVRLWANNVLFQELQVVNQRLDAGGQYANAISFGYQGGEPQFKSNITVRRCYMHGEATLWLHQYKGVALTESVFSGYENSLVSGHVSTFSVEYSVIAYSSVFRVEPTINRGSPSLHPTRGIVTAANCSIVSVAQANDLPQDNSNNLAYRGVLNANANGNYFGCTFGANAKLGVTYSGSFFYGVFAQTGSRVNVVGCAVRAVGKPAMNVEAIHEDATSTILPPDSLAGPSAWTLLTTTILP